MIYIHIVGVTKHYLVETEHPIDYGSKLKIIKHVSGTSPSKIGHEYHTMSPNLYRPLTPEEELEYL